MSKTYIPPQVIQYMVKHMHEGCLLETFTEVYNGTPVIRWVIGQTIVWTLPIGEVSHED